MKKKIVIIGGGVSGLSAGIYALKNGYDALILEKNDVAGGLCTSWTRKGMKIDGCIHWLSGTNPQSSIYQSWQDVHAFKDQSELIYLDNWGSFNYEGTVITFYRDLDRAEKEWCEIAPIDSKMIHKFFKSVRQIKSVDLPLDAPAMLLPLKVKLKFVKQLLKAFPGYFIAMLSNSDKYSKKFKHPALRWALKNVQYGAGNLYSMMYSYATIANKSGGIPIGGSKTLTNNMLNYFLNLGGKIVYNAEATEIVTEKRYVTGVKLKNGDVVTGDFYISCLDANFVLINLLNNKYVHHQIADRYNKPTMHPAPSCVLITYEVPSEVVVNVPYNFKVDSFDVGNKKIDRINMRVFNYDETFIKNGKTTLQVLLDQDSNDFAFWQNLYENKEKYLEITRFLSEHVKNLIEKEVPLYKGKMSALDVATPMTLYRYVNATRGSYMSFLFNPKKGVIASKGRVGGLKNFLLSGQYVQTPGGLPLALASGKYSIAWIKHFEGKK